MSQFDGPVAAIVVAAGSGSRLGASVPKALVPVAGVPLVAHAVSRLLAGGCDHVVVVVPPGMVPQFHAVLAPTCPVPLVLVEGGAERQDSVAHGLAALDTEPLAGASVVLVHDAARAFVPPEVVRSVVDAVRGGAVAAIPVVPVVDSLRQVDASGSAVVDRAPLRAVQTPQGFEPDVLRAAHAAVAASGVTVTDDAAACELLGHRVALVPGSRDALKVTEPLDLVVAEAIAGRSG